MERSLDHEFIDAEGGAPERFAHQKVLDLSEIPKVSAVVNLLRRVTIEHAFRECVDQLVFAFGGAQSQKDPQS